MSMYRDEHESGLKKIKMSVQETPILEDSGNLNTRFRQKPKCLTNVVRNYPFGRILRAIGEPAHQLHSAPIRSGASPQLAICSQNG